MAPCLATAWRKVLSPRPVRVGWYWSIVISSLCLPILLGMVVLSVIHADEGWVRIVAPLFWIAIVYGVDDSLRGSLNRNVCRVDSALQAEQAAPAEQRPIALILRSFGERHGYVDWGVTFGIFELVEPALRKAGFVPCVLGSDVPLPPEHGVAMVLCKDEDWWSNFELLARHAAVIVVVPEATDSLVLEIKALGNRQLLSKVLVLMMPESLPINVSFTDMPWFQQAGDEDKRRRRWSAACEIWKSTFRQALPPWRKAGALVEIGNAAEVVSVRPLRIFELDQAKVPYIDSLDTEQYKKHYGVDFNQVLCQMMARRRFDGPPLREVWPMLAREPLEIGLWGYWRPPGDNGQLRHNAGILLGIGWAPVVLLVGVYLWHVIGDVLAVVVEFGARAR